ncbi:MAG: oxygen-independent coproporphyrinogen III oxidase, partial [Schleiferiaceae bacterium]|nr:oxygen-independent coproporphyrinogen III oxidase [Schleiferiaceae bacterium]
TKNHDNEAPYIDAILKEWHFYLQDLPRDFQISGIHLGGGTPTFFSPENLKKLISGIFSQAHVEAGEWYSFEGHPGNTTEEHLRTLYDLGFRRVSYGIQDFDPVVQQAIHRIQPVEEVKIATELARKVGYTSVNYDLIYGLPFQTTSGLNNTLEKVANLNPDRIAFYSYAHVPWVSKSQRAYGEKDLPNPQVKWKLYQQGCAFFNTNGYEDVGMDHFVRPTDALFKARESGELHRNFMGYTHKREKLLLGLGVSAISDVGGAYWQNVKSVEGYHEQLNTERFPVFKGHLTTESDQVRRKHILNIACQFETHWSPEENKYLEAKGILSRLKNLENDGLLKLKSNSLELTPLGKDLLRLCCAAFDAFLPERAEGVFSKAI